MRSILRKFLIIVGGLLAFLAYGFIYEYYRGTQSYSHMSNRRMEAAAGNVDNEVHLAVVWSKKEDQSFINGIDIAVSEINRTGISLKNQQGQITSSKLVIHRFDDTEHREAEQAAQDIAEDERITAVLGYSHSSRAIPASTAFEYNGVLFLSTAATQSVLTNHRFKYVFSLGPIDEQYFAPIIEFAQKRSIRTMAILYDRTSTGRNFFNKFTASMSDRVKFLYKKSLSPDESEQLEAIYYAASSGADAVALGIRSSEDSAKIIKKLREMGFKKPIFGTKAMDNSALPGWLNGQGKDIYISTPVRTDPLKQISQKAQTLPESKEMFDVISAFNNEYMRRYRTKPGFLAYQGYFSTYLYKLACEKAGTSVPLSVASALKYTDENGIMGIEFDEHNRRKDITMYLKAVSGPEFVDID